MAFQKPGGGGVASDEVNATKANVLAGKTALTSDSNDEVGTGTLPLASVMANQGGTLPLSSVLADNGGSMTNRGNWVGYVGVGGSQNVPQGYHAGSGYVYGPSDGNLVSGNIRNGVSIFGVWGNVRKYAQTNTVLYRSGDTRVFYVSGQARSLHYLTINCGFYNTFFSAVAEGTSTNVSCNQYTNAVYYSGEYDYYIGIAECSMNNSVSYIPLIDDRYSAWNVFVGGYY